MIKFHRGYDHFSEIIAKKPRYLMSCLNCNDYFKAEGDKEECCQNQSVLEYDIVVESNRVYCLKWRPVADKVVKDSTFKYEKVRTKKDSKIKLNKGDG